jgi:DNA repair exonuclease SbcCD ATPase subunit
MSEYDQKKSTKVVGQLYPVLVDKAGNVIDGAHRREADPNWRTEVHPEIDTEEKFLVARSVANWHRRQVSAEEKAEWINALAELYRKQGYKVKGKKTVIKGGYTNTNEILIKIMENTGLSQSTVGKYLSNEYKAKVFEDKHKAPMIPASQRIFTEFKSKTGSERYAKELVERHREEVKDALKTDVDFIVETVKEHPEVVSKAIKQVSSIAEPVYVPAEDVEKAKGKAEEIEAEKRKLDSDAKIIEKRRLFENFTNLQQIALYASQAKCPVCGADHSNLVWECHNLTPEEALDKAHKKLEADK